MISFNVSEETITGSVGDNVFSCPYTPEKYNAMKDLYAQFQQATSMEDAKDIMLKFEELTHYSLNDMAVTKSDQIFFNEQTGTYHLNLGGLAHPVPMPQNLVDYILESSEKGIPVDPVIKFWMRLLRNPNIRKDNPKEVARFTSSVVDYVTRKFVSPTLKESLLKEGFSEEVAIERATVRQTPLTMEGLVSTKKVVEPLWDRMRWKYIPDGEGGVKRVPRDGVQQVNEDTGKITYTDPAVAEDFVFQPWVMKDRYDPFTCGDEGLGHIIKVGKEMALQNWDQVNCDPDAVHVKGLHTGNQDYIRGYETDQSITLNCFVDPAEIGTVAAYDSVLRVKSMFPYSIKDRSVDNKNLYHSSTYAAQKDAEWDAVKAELVKEYTESQEEYIAALKAQRAVFEGI